MYSSNKLFVFVAFIIFNFVSFSHAEDIVFENSKWTILHYRKIPQNRVIFTNSSMVVNVNGSAGPIVYKLDAPQDVVSFSINGSLSGIKEVEKGEFDEDSILRFGLVVTGDKTLSGPKRLFAAEWVKKLFSLAPKGVGLDKIYFYNITNRDAHVGQSRRHPKSDLIHEENVSSIKNGGDFSVEYKLKTPLSAAAIWLSIDGDDTKSKFTTIIKQISLSSVN